MDGPLFVAGKDMGKMGFVNGIIQAQYGSARVAEDHRDLFCLETCKDASAPVISIKGPPSCILSFSNGPGIGARILFNGFWYPEPAWGKSI